MPRANQSETVDAKGPFSYENWKACLAGAELVHIDEYPLYTDAIILDVAKSGYGPYAFLNTVPDRVPLTVQAPIIVRYKQYIRFDQYDLPPTDKTDTGRYHGGGPFDEIAAITSLCLGIRAKAGAVARWFDRDGDPLGEMTSRWNDRPPQLITQGSRLVIPSATGEHTLALLSPFRDFVSLRPDVAVAVVRAARLYQDALWLAESQPHLSWLMLVSAAETGASRWLSSPKGKTDACARFLLNFMPSPIEPRAPEYARYPWNSDSLDLAIRRIYHHRNAALHYGTPFPAPLCRKAWEPEPGRFAETVIAEASMEQGGVWVQKDTPILLHVFEHIVRGALLHWWASLSETGTSA